MRVLAPEQPQNPRTLSQLFRKHALQFSFDLVPHLRPFIAGKGQDQKRFMGIVSGFIEIVGLKLRCAARR
jgi:hypothetical protein